MAEQKDAHETRDATQPLTTDEAAPRIRWRKRGEGTRVEEGDPALSSEADAAGQGQESAHGENMADLQGRLAAEHARAEDALGSWRALRRISPTTSAAANRNVSSRPVSPPNCSCRRCSRYSITWIGSWRPCQTP